MISAILLINQKGQVLIGRFYRDDVSRTHVETFLQQVIRSKQAGTSPPVALLERTSYLYARHQSMYFVALTRSNVNPALVFEYLYQKIAILKAYMGDTFDEDKVMQNLTLIYELMDETMDFGYPQNCAIDTLRLYIKIGNVRQPGIEEKDPSQLTSQITGAINWRQPGIRYRKNEVYIDVVETANLLMSASGQVLRNDVQGSVMMKTQLSGMPECKFALNDKLIMDQEPGGGAANARRARTVEIDDCTFHRCVRLGKFDADRTITFIPPDGEFELMRYRVTDNINLPLKVIPAIQEEGRLKVNINIKAIAAFPSKLNATNVVIKVPVPPNTARVDVKVGTGRARFEPEQRAIVWRIKRFSGESETLLGASVDLMPSTREKAWSRPPISVEGQVPMFCASGVYVRFLRVYEKSGYTAQRWVRYVTRLNGEGYQFRI